MIHLYCKSMGKIFRVTKIAKSEDEANLWCKNHDQQGVIAVDNDLIFIAEFNGITVKSDVLPD